MLKNIINGESNFSERIIKKIDTVINSGRLTAVFNIMNNFLDIIINTANSLPKKKEIEWKFI